MSIDIFKNNENEWVVTDVQYQKIIASGKNLRELQKKVKQMKIKDAVISFAPPFDKSFAPLCQ